MKKIFFLLIISLPLLTAAQTILPKNKIQQPVNPNVPRIQNPPVAKGIITKQTVTIRPATLTDFCPWKKKRGDNDFSDHEVYVTVNINFEYNMRYGDTVLRAKVSLTGLENGGDATEVSGDWRREVYKAPAGWRIKNISNGTSSLASYFSFSANPAQRYSGGSCPMKMYQLNPNNFGFPLTSSILQNIKIATDRYKTVDFDETESTCDCGFRITEIIFKPLTVELEKIP